jgi:hypothetical protein
MAKPKKTKYPAKFRVTLEKVAAKREAREAASDTVPEDDHRFATMYHSLLPRKSVHLMHSRLEETPFGVRLITPYQLLADTDVYDLVRVPAPFDEPEPS